MLKVGMEENSRLPVVLNGYKMLSFTSNKEHELHLFTSSYGNI